MPVRYVIRLFNWRTDRTPWKYGRVINYTGLSLLPSFLLASPSIASWSF